MNSKWCVKFSILFFVIIIVLSGCTTQQKTKKLVIVEQPKPVLLPELPPPPQQLSEPIVVLPPPPEVIVTPPPPPPKPIPLPPRPKKPIQPQQFATVKTPPISILGKKVTTVDVMSAPGVHNAVVAKVADGNRVLLLGKPANDWFKIKLPNGTIGWISASFLIIPKNVSP